MHRGLLEWQELLPKLRELSHPLSCLGDAMMACWQACGKVLIAGNGGSAADAMHFAEELVARFEKDRKGLAAIALCDPTVLTCAANDFGFEQVFSRQVEALGNPNDILIVLSTSGNSPNILRAIEAANQKKMLTAAFLGRDGGKAKGLCPIELIIPAEKSHRIQEGHKILYHTLCEWVDSQMEADGRSQKP